MNEKRRLAKKLRSKLHRKTLKKLKHKYGEAWYENRKYYVTVHLNNITEKAKNKQLS